VEVVFTFRGELTEKVLEATEIEVILNIIISNLHTKVHINIVIISEYKYTEYIEIYLNIKYYNVIKLKLKELMFISLSL